MTPLIVTVFVLLIQLLLLLLLLLLQFSSSENQSKGANDVLESSNQSGKLAGEKKEKVRISFGVTCNFFRGVTCHTFALRAKPLSCKEFPTHWHIANTLN
jgi:hypothetical protein